jgi:ATP-dependent Lon protease
LASLPSASWSLVRERSDFSNGLVKESPMTFEAANPVNSPLNPSTLPILPLRAIVLFPGITVPVFVGREPSKRAIEAAAAGDIPLLCIAQKTDEDAPTSEGLFSVGTVARVLQRRELPDGSTKVLLECIERAAILNYTAKAEYFEATIELVENPVPPAHVSALEAELTAKFLEFANIEGSVSAGGVDAVQRMGDVGRKVDTIASHIPGEIADRQAVLEAASIAERIEKLLLLIDKRISGPAVV